MPDGKWTALVIAHMKRWRKIMKDGLKRKFCIWTIAEFSSPNHCCAEIDSVDGQPDLVVITACADDRFISSSIRKMQEKWPETQFVIIYCCGDVPKDAYALPNVHSPAVGDEELHQLMHSLGMDRSKQNPKQTGEETPE